MIMMEAFADVLAVDGKKNSLGRSGEVVQAVLSDKSRLDELYKCLFEDDAWVRMRAADAIEKVFRQRPGWSSVYIDRFLDELSDSTQPSIQWHLAEIYGEVELSDAQRTRAIAWLSGLLSTIYVDWIVAGNCMNTTAAFAEAGWMPKHEALNLISVQKQHKSKAVAKRAQKLIDQLSD